jgi:signal transduction histidine kinase
MLQVGRPRRPERAVTNLAQLVSEVVAMARAASATMAEVQIEYEAPDGPAEAEVDAAQLRQVVWNLLKNAVQASPPQSSVFVAVRCDPTVATVEIRDEGAGITADEKRVLFDTFYSSRPHGVGLGLALVQQIVGAHGGQVEVDSEPGKGAIFRVSVPVVARPTVS